jgi:hypothetical protein
VRREEEHKWRVGKKLAGKSRNYLNILSLNYLDTDEQHEKTGEIRTGYAPNVSLKPYSYTNLLVLLFI